MAERRLSPADAAWLYSEWEKNNQTVSSLMWLDREIDPDLFTSIVQERIVDKYPTFSQRLRPSRNPLYLPHWENDPEFDIGNHIEVLQLETGTKEELRALVSEQRSQLLDRERPLWKMYVFQGYNGDTTAIHSRIQHSIADGWALVRLVLSLCDDSETVDRPTTIDKPRRRKRDIVGRATAPVVDIVRSPIDFVQETLAVALHPKRFIEFGTDVLGVAEDTTEASKNAVEFLLAPRPGKTILHGEVSGEKKVDWIEPVDLQPIKDIGRATGTTINDVLLAVLTNALRKYLVEKDGLTVDDLFTAVPVSLRRPDADLPRTLGNRFGLIPVLLPVSLEDPVEQLQEIHRRVEELKDSQMPIVSFGLISVSSLMTPDLERLLHKVTQEHSIGVTTNVPGPRHPIYVAGGKVLGSWGMGGLSGNMNLSFGIYSLNGQLNFSVHSDTGITDDPERILDFFLESIEELRELVLDAE
ncbi:MAG TPA: wax ester/triacylglycerol synthase family O-acyltransferase [Candidatus Nanopelagicales bacterium]|nr:wax ester/triacylglycerol synthase family O-acyltransferase [Candidatus Nanopelagicales bacterium]